MTVSRITSVVALIVAQLVIATACAPFGQRGDACDDAPCAPGLICTQDGICDEPPPPPPPPCADDSECLLDGDASGRVCDEGVCRFDDCALDAQCGTRICVDGTCAPRVPCVNDGQCEGGDLCVDNACRPPCRADDDCGLNLGGIGLNACVEGRCLQRCFGDGTCFGGGVCEGNICIEPECAEAADCGDGDVLCESGRCTSFTPCAADPDCFDPNLECAVDEEPARCVERPLCRADADCGLEGICLGEHCRPAEGCFVAADCASDDDECVGGRCVRRPPCRQSADCADGERCVNLRCVAAPAPVTAAAIEVADAWGPCGAGCRRLLFVGERLDVLAQGYDGDGRPVEATIAADSADDDLVGVVAARAGVQLEAKAPGTSVVTIGGVPLTIVVVARADDTGAREVVVAVIEADGVAAPAGTRVTVGGATEDVDAAGVVRFAPAPSGPVIFVRAPDGRGVAYGAAVDAGSFRLTLPSLSPLANPAPLNVTVTSTGDETGPVGLGLVLPSVGSPGELTLTRLLGDIVQAPLTLPIIGVLPVGVPSSMTVEATLALVGQQNLRPTAETLVAAGPAFILALEARREQDTLIALALGGDPLAFALELLGDSETADLAIAAAGTIDARALVADTADRDGDGNTAEPVPDFAGAPTLDVRPSQPPQERGALTASLPDGASTGVVIAGFVLPGRLVPAGASILRGLENFEGVPLSESFRAVAASAGLALAPRSLAVVADFGDDALRSRAFLVGDSLPTDARLGRLLSPPTGGRVIADVPAPGDVTALLPTVVGADLLRLRLQDADGVVDVYVAPSGSVRLPENLAGETTLQRVDAFVVGGLAALGVGLPGAIDVVATKASSAPGG